MDSEGPGGPPDLSSAPQPSPSVPDADEAAAAAEKKKKKKKDKVRSAWISFAGRIVAQIVGAAATIVLGIYLVTSHRGEPDRASSRVPRVARTLGAEPSLAVLPFDNYSGDASQDYFVNGMTEALIADLARVRGLRVISRTSSMHYQGQKKSLPEIAGELGVDLLVEGSVARSGNRVRITAQLIDGASDEHIWARSYEDKVEDVLALQSRIATAIAGEVRGAVSSSAAGTRRAVDPEVYDLYLRGRNAWNTRSPEGFEQARTYFQQAIDKDPSFALAHAGLADTYQVAGLLSGTPDGPARAREAAERALALDDSLGEAHASLAGTLHRPVADIPRAEAEFKRAIELNPGYATAHQWYAIMLAEEGRDREALEHAERAVALDPLAGVMQQTLGLVNYFGRRYDRAGADGTARPRARTAPHAGAADRGPLARRAGPRRGSGAGAERATGDDAGGTGRAGHRLQPQRRRRQGGGDREGSHQPRSPAARRAGALVYRDRRHQSRARGIRADGRPPGGRAPDVQERSGVRAPEVITAVQAAGGGRGLKKGEGLLP